MPTLTRAQFMLKYDRLLRRIKSSKIKDDISATILNVARSTLEYFVPDQEDVGSEQSSFTLPGEEEVETFIRDMLPPPAELFSEYFFKSPMFSFSVLKDVATLLGCPETSANYFNQISLSEQDKMVPRHSLIIWFAWMTDCEKRMCESVVERFKLGRGSFNPLVRASLANHQPANTVDLNISGAPAPQSFSSPQAPTPQNGFSSAPAGNGRSHNEQSVPSLPLGTNMEPRRTPQQSFPEIVRGGNESSSKKANYVQQMFKDCRFTGEISQDISETLRMYDICARQHNLSRSQKADFFVHVFDGPARKYFFDNVDESLQFHEMANFMIKEYISDARQLQVKGTLESLRLRKFMTEKGIDDVSEGLTKLVELINELSPQCPRDFRSDSHKIDFLRKAVLEYQEWSKIPIQSITSQGYSFNGFATALHEAIQNLRQFHLITGLPNDTHLSAEVQTNLMQYGRKPSTNRYGRRTVSSRGKRPESYSSRFDEARRRNTCYKCGAENWTKNHRCKKGAIVSHARERLRNGESSIHLVADLVQQLEGDIIEEESVSGGDDSPTDNNDLNTFDGYFADESADNDPIGTNINRAIELTDGSIIINHLNSAMTEDNDSGFHKGDEDC